MSNELIRKTDVLDLLNEFYSYFEDYEVYSILFDNIDNMYPVNAVEQKQGHWIPIKPLLTAARCSECKSAFAEKTNYCPNCGTKMEGEKNG